MKAVFINCFDVFCSKEKPEKEMKVTEFSFKVGDIVAYLYAYINDLRQRLVDWKIEGKTIEIKTLQ